MVDFEDSMDLFNDGGDEYRPGDYPRVEEVEEDEPEEQVAMWVPTQLAGTIAKEEQRAQDQRACQNIPCQLCVNLDDKLKGCAEFVKKIYAIESTNRDDIAPTVLFEIIATRYNETVYLRNVEYYGPEEAAERGVYPLTVPMVRMHYEHHHVKNPVRLLWEIVEYERDCIEQLQKSSLWIMNLTDPTAQKQPNEKNFNVLLRLNDAIRANITLAERLAKTGQSSLKSLRG